MENDKNELQYVINLLKKSPPKEISKEYSSFTINKKWQFNLKPEAKFDGFNNNGFINNKILNTIQKNEFSQKKENLVEKDNSALSTFFQKENSTISNQKASTLYQNYKPNLNIRKFSNIPKATSLNRENKWFTNNNLLYLYLLYYNLMIYLLIRNYPYLHFYSFLLLGILANLYMVENLNILFLFLILIYYKMTFVVDFFYFYNNYYYNLYV